MGRNGKKPSVFTEMVNFINNNVGKKISSKEKKEKESYIL